MWFVKFSCNLNKQQTYSLRELDVIRVKLLRGSWKYRGLILKFGGQGGPAEDPRVGGASPDHTGKLALMSGTSQALQGPASPVTSVFGSQINVPCSPARIWNCDTQGCGDKLWCMCVKYKASNNRSSREICLRITYFLGTLCIVQTWRFSCHGIDLVESPPWPLRPPARWPLPAPRCPSHHCPAQPGRSASLVAAFWFAVPKLSPAWGYLQYWAMCEAPFEQNHKVCVLWGSDSVERNRQQIYEQTCESDDFKFYNGI